MLDEATLSDLTTMPPDLVLKAHVRVTWNGIHFEALPERRRTHEGYVVALLPAGVMGNAEPKVTIMDRKGERRVFRPHYDTWELLP